MNTVAAGNSREVPIYRLRGSSVMLDNDLAGYYGVPTRILNRAVRRVIARFPDEFMFCLSPGEVEALKREHGAAEPWIAELHRRPFAFTEEGIHAICYFLHSPRAIQMSVELIRGFHSMRKMVDEQKGLFDVVHEIKRRQEVESKRLWTAIRSIRELELFRDEMSSRMLEPGHPWLSQRSKERYDAFRYELARIEQRAMRHRDLFYLILMIFGTMLAALILVPK